MLNPLLFNKDFLTWLLFTGDVINKFQAWKCLLTNMDVTIVGFFSSDNITSRYLLYALTELCHKDRNWYIVVVKSR